jgi:hypothetical protein
VIAGSWRVSNKRAIEIGRPVAAKRSMRPFGTFVEKALMDSGEARPSSSSYISAFVFGLASLVMAETAGTEQSPMRATPVPKSASKESWCVMVRFARDTVFLRLSLLELVRRKTEQERKAKSEKRKNQSQL